MGKKHAAKVTPAMIDAGLAVLMEWTDAIGDVPDRDMVREIYSAMAANRAASAAAAPNRKGAKSGSSPPRGGYQRQRP